MKTHYHPPRIAENILAFFAGPHFENEICGDMQERFGAGRHGPLWYWGQTLRAIPQLILMQSRELSRENYLHEAIFILLALSLLWSWEISIARQASWPLAQQILPYSPLTPAETCKAIYVTLYGGALLFGLCLFSAWSKLFHKTQYFKKVHFLLLTIIASTPIIYLFVNPGPYDGPRDFRAYQLGLTWGLFILVIMRPLQSFRHFTTINNC